jgi:hypothetical protein
MIAIRFDGGVIVEIFPNVSRLDRGGEGFSLLLPRISIVVLAGGTVRFEKSGRYRAWRDGASE